MTLMHAMKLMHTMTLTAELILVTHTNAQLSTCLYRLNRCRSLGEVGLCSRNICPPNPPIYIPHRLQGRGAVLMYMLCDFSAKGILSRPLTTSYWLKLYLSVCSYSYCICCLHMQPPYLGFQFPCLVYVTRLGHSRDWNRRWLIPCLQRWICLSVCFSICVYVSVSLHVFLWSCLSSSLIALR